jgi:polyisoprenoid-binding protein YceI
VFAAVRTHRLITAVTALVTLAALIAAAVWYVVIRDDGAFHFVLPDTGPPPVSLKAALASVSNTGLILPPSFAHAGAWVVVEDEHSFAGYRVRETLASFGANTAVGRTTSVAGSLTFDGNAITGAEFTADLTTLTSDQNERDEALGDQAIETDLYPAATFVLGAPIPIEEVPPDGKAVSHTVVGDLTLHGVTREVAVEVEAAMQNGLLVVAGSAEIRFADFAIERPVSFSVLSIEDHGTLEFQLVLRPGL